MIDRKRKPLTISIHTGLILSEQNLRYLTDEQLQALSEWTANIRSERMQKQKQIQHHYTGGVNGLVKKAKNLAKKLRRRTNER